MTLAELGFLSDPRQTAPPSQRNDRGAPPCGFRTGAARHGDAEHTIPAPPVSVPLALAAARPAVWYGQAGAGADSPGDVCHVSRMRTMAVLVAAAVTGVVAAVAIVAAVSFRGVAPRMELTAAEKSLLVQVDDLAPFGIVPRTGRYTETFKAKRNLDRSLELEYAYEAADSAPPFSLKSEAEICGSEKDASESFSARVSAYRFGFRMAGKKGTELRAQAAPASLGQERYLGQVCVAGKPAGCALVARQGRTVFSVLLSGAFIDDGEDWTALLGPRLAQEGSITVGDR